MDIGEMFDWLGRIFGIAFLLFALSILFFPSWREPLSDAEESIDNVPEHIDPRSMPPRPASAPQAEPEQESGTVLMFPVHRRAGRL